MFISDEERIQDQPQRTYSEVRLWSPEKFIAFGATATSSHGPTDHIERTQSRGNYRSSFLRHSPISAISSTHMCAATHDGGWARSLAADRLTIAPPVVGKTNENILIFTFSVKLHLRHKRTNERTVKRTIGQTPGIEFGAF